MNSETLETTVKMLAQCRKDYVDALAEKKALLEELNARPEVKAVIEKCALAQAAVEGEEAVLRTQGEEQYAVDQNKHGIGYDVRIETSVEINDTQAATAWCLHNFTPALRLDEKMVKTSAKNGSFPAELVTITTAPKIFIKSDLGEYLK